MYNELAPLSEEARKNEIAEVTEWAFNLLRQKRPKSRYSSLVAFSFLIEIEDNESKLLQLTADLDKLLPADQPYILNGIAYLLARLTQLVPPTFLGRIFNRCVGFLTNRVTPAAIQTAVVLMQKLGPLSTDLFHRTIKELPTFIWTALKFSNPEIQRKAVNVYTNFVWNSTNSDELLRGMVSMCIVTLQSFQKSSECLSVFVILDHLLKKKSEYVSERFDELFSNICKFLASNRDSNSLATLAALCESNPEKSCNHIDELAWVLDGEWPLAENCESFVRIAQVVQGRLGKICSTKAFNILDEDENTFFRLISADYPEPQDMLTIFQDCSSLSRGMVLSAVHFLDIFPEYTFKMINLIKERLLTDLNNTNSFLFIHKVEKCDVFPFNDFWDRILPFMYEKSEPAESKIILVKALMTIIKRDRKTQHDRLRTLLYVIQDSNIPEVVVSALEEVDDSLLYHFDDNTVLHLLMGLMSVKSISVSSHVILLLKRIRQFSPLITFNVMYNLFEKMDNEFFQGSSLAKQRKIMELWPCFIDAADDFLFPFSANIIAFLLERLESIPPPTNTFRNKVEARKNMKHIINIHVLAMKALQILLSRKFELDNLQNVVDHLINQLGIFDSEQISLTALDTLRILFRSRSTKDINIPGVHKSITSFAAKVKQRSVLYRVLRILGTIGPVDPISFHMDDSNNRFETLALYDPLKRDQCYLEFVMKFILASLQRPDSDHSVLLNAILYIFQFDATKSTVFLKDLIPILSNLLQSSHSGSQKECDEPTVQHLTSDSIFHMLRSIVLLVGIEIQPFAEEVVDMLLPFIETSNLNLAALKTLSAIVYAMKSSFRQFAVSTFSRCLVLLSKKWDSEIDLNLLQILTHLVIYCNGSQKLFFQQIKQKSDPNLLTAPYAIRFLGQAISYHAQEELLLPAIRLGLSLIPKEDEKETLAGVEARKLLSILAEKVPKFVPQQFHSDSPVVYEVSADYMPQRSPPPIKPLRVGSTFANFQFENNRDTWLRHVSQILVLCSNSPAIRSCHPLLQSFPDLATHVFPLILLSVWDIATEEERKSLSMNLLLVARNKDVPLDLLGVFSDTIDAMDRAGYCLFDPEISGDIVERCGHWFRSVRFYERAPQLSDDIKYKSIVIHTKLHRREAAHGIFSVTGSVQSNAQLLEQLSLWSDARRLYNPYDNDPQVVGYVGCSAKLGDWEAIGKFFDRFNHMSYDAKRSSAVDFAMAARFLNGNTEHFLNHAPKGSAISCLMRAVVAYDKKQLKEARRWLERGMKINSDDVTAFLSGNYESCVPSIDYATFFEEMSDVIDVAEGVITIEKALDIWNSKSEWIKTDTSQLQSLFLVRQLLHPNHLDLVDVSRKLHAWDIYDNAFGRIVNKDDELVNLLRIKVRFDRHQTTDMNEFVELIENTKDHNILVSALCSLCRRCQSPDEKVMKLVRARLHDKVQNSCVWRYWAYGNLALHSQGHHDHPEYTVNAMQGFSELVKLNGPCLNFVCHMFSLLIEGGKSLIPFIKGIPLQSVELVLDQLLSHFEHPDSDVRNTIIEMVKKFAEENHQAVGFPMAFRTRCGHVSPNFDDFVMSMQKQRPGFYNELMTLTEGLLATAFPVIERIIFDFENAIENYEKTMDPDQFRVHYKHASALFHLEHTGINETLNQNWVNSHFVNIENAQKSGTRMANYAEIKHEVEYLVQSFKICLAKKTEDPIHIKEFSTDLISKAPFSVAIPGTPGGVGDYPTIRGFKPIVEIMDNKDRPRKIKMISSDGKTYQYLLMNRKDLRLDQRIMQWFSLVNSVLNGEMSRIENKLAIERYPVIPLSPHAGMISLIGGTDTIKDMIKWMKEKSPEQELTCDTFPHYRTSIQKLEAFRECCAWTADNLLREAIWLKSRSADVWFSQKTNFARSSALMSIVGHVIGLGERHPLNIMYMHNSGNVVHLDLSECFDKAKNRALNPERVPFRLTRMMVSVLGIGGIEGIFTKTASYVMNLMRLNQFSLIAFLDISSGAVIEDSDYLEKVKNKLNGNETEDDQVRELIKEATCDYNLAQMDPVDWMPHW